MEIPILLQHRVAFLNRAIDAQSANTLIEQLLLLDAQNSETRIDLYVNSPGGSVSDGLAILDVMSCVAAPISTVCIGRASSMATWVVAAGTPGLRFAAPHAELMIHQMAGGFSGQTDDIQLHAERMVRLQNQLVEMLSSHTGQSTEKIAADMARDFFMSPAQAQDYGLIDGVLQPFKQPPFSPTSQTVTKAGSANKTRR